MPESSNPKSLDRVEGKLKVTGAARYTGDFDLPRLTHAVLVESSIPHGKITKMDVEDAEKAPGVVAIITHRNATKLKAPGAGTNSEAHLVLQSDKIAYNGQIVALVVAESFEEATYASSLIHLSYEQETAYLDIGQAGAPSYLPAERFGIPLQKGRGDADKLFASAAAKVDATYTTPVEHHNPMEPHATLANWKGDELTVYETTQYVNGTQEILAKIFGLKPEQVQVISHFVGGGFGAKGSTWQHTALAAMAAQQTKRPVKLVLTRQNMFTCVGHRSRTIQRVALGADEKGKLTAVHHDVQSHTSTLQDFIESSAILTRMLYAIPNLGISQKVARLNRATSTYMRAPGETSGSFALESAMDELAYKLNMDPVELRLINHADNDIDSGKPWSSKHLKTCYQKAAEQFGWSKRQPKPASMRDGRWQVGFGMATATYPGNRQPASAKIRIAADGTVSAASATHEMGQGTYTVMTQIVSEYLGVPASMVRFDLGNSLYPKAPVAGGSMTVASVGPAVAQAARALKEKILNLAAQDEHSPLRGLKVDQVKVENGRMMRLDQPQSGVAYKDILRRAKQPFLEAEVTTTVAVRGHTADHCRSRQSDDPSCYSFHSFGAQFAEVKIDPNLMEVHVTRFVGMYDVGKVLNEKMARSQGIGGIVMGIGMALMEETTHDPTNGRIMTRNFADYHVPVYADIPAIEVLFTNESDFHFNELGSRGLGEIPIVGAAAAVANAVYHATGKRMRDLPITPAKLV